MDDSFSDPTATIEWEALNRHYHEIENVSISSMFESDPGRCEAMVLQEGDLVLDYSKNRMTPETLHKLVALAQRADLQHKIESMFEGERINRTEDRSVMHTALRHPPRPGVRVDGRDVLPGIHRVLQRMESFCERVGNGRWRGYSGETIRSVVNIGIGGSDLGPRMCVHALRHYRHDRVRTHFVSNVDPSNLVDVLSQCSPATTLFVVCSKSFGTEETLANAETARQWLLDRSARPDSVARHFVAVSANAERVAAFGIDPSNMFEFWDWVGGRYSFTSAVGLSIMLAIGVDHFRDLLAGFHTMDRHFRTAPLDRNMPVLLGLIGIWYNNFFDCCTKAVIPYDYDLRLLPEYLQQTDMESNGKCVSQNNQTVSWQTGPIVWGQSGTNGQHAFFQLLHQGTRLIPVDLIAFERSNNPRGTHHPRLLANVLAQAEALAFGKSAQQVRQEGVGEEQLPHRVFPGNRPTNLILGTRLTPAVLGQLVALYEHQVFVQGMLWNIYSFDQWGVELGKTLATRIFGELTTDSEADGGHDPSTARWIRHLAGRPGGES